MLLTAGAKDILSRFIIFKNTRLGASVEPCFANLKAGYRAEIGGLMPEGLSQYNECATWRIIDTADDARAMLDAYGYGDDALDDLDQIDAIKPTFDGDLVDCVAPYIEAYRFMANTVQSFEPIFDLAINYLLIMPSDVASGGSSSSVPGVIWINPKSHWSSEDCEELLIHELTHNLLFLDELVEPLFHVEDMANKARWCYSAVLKKSRPIDKAYHSAIVAAEVLAYRAIHGRVSPDPCAHPPSRLLVPQTLRSIDECLSSSLLTNRAVALMENARRTIIDDLQLDRAS